MKTFFIFFVCMLSGVTLAFSQYNDLPQWVERLVQEYEQAPVANPPLSISRCEYRGQTVYYVPPRCCDIPSSLFTEEGESLCYPDGGMDGQGDGTCTDFFTEKKDCDVVWQDERSWPPEGNANPKKTQPDKGAIDGTTKSVW